MKLKIYDPMPRNPETAQRVRVCAFTHEPRVYGYIEGSTQMDARKSRVLKSGVRRITYR